MNGGRIGTWRRSSYSSAANSQCVEVADLVTGFGVRDSKDPAGAVVRVAKGGWRALLAAVRADDLSRRCAGSPAGGS